MPNENKGINTNKLDKLINDAIEILKKYTLEKRCCFWSKAHTALANTTIDHINQTKGKQKLTISTEEYRLILNELNSLRLKLKSQNSTTLLPKISEVMEDTLNFDGRQKDLLKKFYENKTGLDLIRLNLKNLTAEAPSNSSSIEMKIK